MYFIKPYPDELFSSVLARYHVHSGNITAAQSAQALFGNQRSVPSVELLGRLSPKLVTSMKRIMPLREWIIRHTMFPEYSCFLPEERLKKALNAATQMDISVLRYLLYMPRGRTDRYLRYCPACAAEDRKIYGEAYWHRCHQLQGVNVCTKHKRRLVKSTASRINGNGMLESSAEIVLSERNDCINDDLACAVIELRVANYLQDVFSQAEIRMLASQMNNTFPIGEFLRSRIRQAYAISKRGALADLDRFVVEMSKYYEDVPDFPRDMKDTIKRMYKGHTMPLYEVCLSGLFLGVGPEDLLDSVVPKVHSAVAFDAEVRMLHNAGCSYNDIARKVGVNRVYVKRICVGENNHNGSHTQRSNHCKSTQHWDLIDTDMFPQVKSVITEMLDESHPPQRVTIGGVAKKLGTTTAHMRKLTRCAKHINEFTCSVEQNRVKKLIWAVHRIDAQGETLIRQRIFELVHMDRRAILSALPFVQDYDINIYQRIMEIVNN